MGDHDTGTFGFDPDKVSRSLRFEVAPAEGYGLGCFATERIKKGTVLLDERPVFVLPSKSTADCTALHHRIEVLCTSGLMKDILNLSCTTSASDALSATYRQKLEAALNCANLTEEEKDRFINIMRTNAFEKDEGTSLYLMASRFNHSCRPNATFSDVKVVALCDINPGDEICLSYMKGSSLRTWKERQETCRVNWNFECRCDLCVSCMEDDTQRQQNDRSRVELRVLLAKFKQFGDLLSTLSMKNFIGAMKSAREEIPILWKSLNRAEELARDLWREATVVHFQLIADRALLAAMAGGYGVSVPNRKPPMSYVHAGVREAIVYGTHFEHMMNIAKLEIQCF